MSSRRLLRINDLLRETISELITRQLKDPRIGAVITVTDVETSADLRHARIFVSVLGSKEEQETALSGLRSATKFLRHELGERVDLKRIPDLTFIHDDSIERGTRILALLDDVAAEEPGRE